MPVSADKIASATAEDVQLKNLLTAWKEKDIDTNALQYKSSNLQRLIRHILIQWKNSDS